MIAFLAQITPETPGIFEGLRLPTSLLKGGVVMIPIILLLFIATYLFIERLLYIRQECGQQKDLVQNITRMIRDSDIKAATMRLPNGKHPLPGKFCVGPQYIGRPMKEIEGVMESDC